MAKSYSEKTVCHDAQLSLLDDHLAIAYAKALALAADKKALSAQRDQQWQWRQRHCHDQQCVLDWYERRLAELEADAKPAEAADADTVKAADDDAITAPKSTTIRESAVTGTADASNASNASNAHNSKPPIRNEQAQRPLIVDPSLPASASGALTLSEAPALTYAATPAVAALPYTGLPLVRNANPATAFDFPQHSPRPKIGIFIDF